MTVDSSELRLYQMSLLNITVNRQGLGLWMPVESSSICDIHHSTCSTCHGAATSDIKLLLWLQGGLVHKLVYRSHSLWSLYFYDVLWSLVIGVIHQPTGILTDYGTCSLCRLWPPKSEAINRMLLRQVLSHGASQGCPENTNETIYGFTRNGAKKAFTIPKLSLNSPKIW